MNMVPVGAIISIGSNTICEIATWRNGVLLSRACGQIGTKRRNGSLNLVHARYAIIFWRPSLVKTVPVEKKKRQIGGKSEQREKVLKGEHAGGQQTGKEGIFLIANSRLREKR